MSLGCSGLVINYCTSDFCCLFFLFIFSLTHKLSTRRTRGSRPKCSTSISHFDTLIDTKPFPSYSAPLALPLCCTSHYCWTKGIHQVGMRVVKMCGRSVVCKKKFPLRALPSCENDPNGATILRLDSVVNLNVHPVFIPQNSSFRANQRRNPFKGPNPLR